MPRISPPAGPTTVPPTSTPRSASSTSLISPSRLRDPAAGRGGEVRLPTRTVEPGVARLLLGHPDAADLGIGEGHVGHGAVVGDRAVLAEHGRDGDRGVVHRHVRERAAADDVADGPQPVAGDHPLVDLDAARRRVEADRLQADVVEVRRPAGRDEQLLEGELLVRRRRP